VTTEPTAALVCGDEQIPVRDERAGVVVAQVCESADEAIGPLTLQTYQAAADLRDAWQEATTATSGLTPAGDACANETPGSDRWGFGNIVCGTSDGKAQIRWTDARSDSLGVVESANDDVAALYEWWRTNARTLGREVKKPETKVTEPKTSAKSEPKPTPVPRKLVRVPGKPGNATCAATIKPIRDEWNRTWNISRVNFKNESGYERVVLQLERTGKNRSRTPTRAAVSRTSVNKLRKVVPQAPTPTRGKVAIALEINGIDDAPSLYNFRPSSLDYVKQISVVKTNGSWTVVIAAPQATCYQVRIPIWSTAATGKERSAEIFIDLKPR
jgi:hypothetical protein